MLDVMIKAGITDKEPIPWEDSHWNPANLPTLEEMKLSPTGLATLELLKNCKPLPREKPEDRTMNASPELPVPDAEAQDKPAPPEASAETPNEYMSRLAWPPRSTPQPKPVEDDAIEHRWVAGTPSKPDTSLKPLAADDFSNNDMIY
jgi:hypothetical protein